MRYTLPFAYGFATRAKTALDKLSFVAIFVFPIYFICSAIQAPFAWLFPRFLLALTAQYCLYEIGYIQNDVYTTRHERHPNVRISQQAHSLVCAIAPQLIFFKGCFALLLLFVLGMLGGINFSLFCVLLCLMLLAFFLHNSIRSRLNILSYALLIGLKYIAIALLFLPVYLVGEGCIALILGFILPRSIEHSAKRKYGLPHSATFDCDRFRVNYYAMLCVISSTMWLNDPRFGLLAMIALWFFGYRSIIYYLLQTTHLKRRYRS